MPIFRAGITCFASAAFALSGAAVSFCSDLPSEINAITFADIKAASAGVKPQKVEAAAAAQPKDWTVMLFMNGKSNVEQFALADMNELEAVGSTDKVNVVAELGRMSGQDMDTDADGNWTGSRRYLVTKDTDTEKISSPVIMQTPNADMGDYRRVADFISWAKARFPAKRYMLVIWDHGWGWLDPKPGAAWKNRSKSISHDFETGHYVKTQELGLIFKKAGAVDLYASMACFMQMMEVAYEIKDYAKVIVGSEEVIQLPSFDFTGFLALLTANPASGPEQAAEYLLDTFKALYSQPDNAQLLEQTKYGVQLSAIRPAKLDALRGHIDSWVAEALALNDAKAAAAAKREVVRFEVGDESTDPDKQISFYGDLYNFVELFSRNSAGGVPGKEAGRLLNCLSSEVVVKNVYLGKDRTGKDYSNTHGLAINIPGKSGTLIEPANSYSSLAFARSSRWPEFIKYLETVR